MDRGEAVSGLAALVPDCRCSGGLDTQAATHTCTVVRLKEHAHLQLSHQCTLAHGFRRIRECKGGSHPGLFLTYLAVPICCCTPCLPALLAAAFAAFHGQMVDIAVQAKQLHQLRAQLVDSIPILSQATAKKTHRNRLE